MTNEHQPDGMTVGCLEPVNFPEFGVEGVLAKIDTGAFSGALHCGRIKVVRNKSGRGKTLSFQPLGSESQLMHTANFFETYVRSATGHRVKRYIIDTEIAIQRRVLPIRIGLSNRSKMTHPILLGRRFLRENGISVDVRINQQYDTEGGKTK